MSTAKRSEEDLIDISWPIKEGMTTEYKDRSTLAVRLRASYDKDAMEESYFCMATHTGTHIDAPSHFIKGGKTIDQFNINTFCGPCQVIDVTSCKEMITKEDLESVTIQPGSIIVLKTANSFLSAFGPFYKNFVYLEKSGAHYLASQYIKAIGIDYLSLERGLPDHPAHKAFLEKDIPIIEGLRLGSVAAGCYYLYCFPLNVIDLEAAPARAVLKR